MYDLKTGTDSGREWVEVFNNSDTIVDFSTYKFFEANTNHKLLLIQGDEKIVSQGYAVIVSDPVKFKIDWPNFVGTIFDSSFSLSNSGETLSIKDGDLIFDEYIYKSSFGGAGDGKSLQKINGSWLSATPTPGVENKISYTPPPVPPQPKSQPVPKEISTEQSKNEDLENILNNEIPEASTIMPENNNSSYFLTIIFILLLGAGGGAIYFIRRKKITPKTGEDFEILE